MLSPARSYDVLRLNSSMEHCGFLTSHDDHSITQYMPPDTAVITQLREPVDRILSSYEFAVEVAVRALHADPNRPQKPPIKPKINQVSTMDVWPWSLLVPMLEADLKIRVSPFWSSWGLRIQ